jgi:hypothetical protein
MPGLIDEKKAKKRALAAEEDEGAPASVEKKKKKSKDVDNVAAASSPPAKKLKGDSGVAVAPDSSTAIVPAAKVVQPKANSMSAADFTKLHDLNTMGEDVPAAFQTFEAAGFPKDIMDEVSALAYFAINQARLGSPRVVGEWWWWLQHNWGQIYGQPSARRMQHCIAVV